MCARTLPTLHPIPSHSAVISLFKSVGASLNLSSTIQTKTYLVWYSLSQIFLVLVELLLFPELSSPNPQLLLLTWNTQQRCMLYWHKFFVSLCWLSCMITGHSESYMTILFSMFANHKKTDFRPQVDEQSALWLQMTTLIFFRGMYGYIRPDILILPARYCLSSWDVYGGNFSRVTLSGIKV